jgi:hypothetical protein
MSRINSFHVLQVQSRIVTCANEKHHVKLRKSITNFTWHRRKKIIFHMNNATWNKQFANHQSANIKLDFLA